MTPESARRYWWKATHALREAETLTSLGNVSGPADAPPATKDDEEGWVADWRKRAAEAMKGAFEKWQSGNDKLRDRAKEIANRIAEGAKAIQRANPVAAAKEKLGDMISAAQTLQGGMFGLGIVGTVVLAWVAYELFLKGK